MKRLTQIMGIAMVLCMLFTLVSFASNGKQDEKITYRSISIVVNGSEIAPCDVSGNSTEPFIRNADGSTYLPVRAVAGALGLDVDWNDSSSTVILKSGGKVQTGTNKPVKTNRTITASLYYRNIVITLDGKAVALKNAQGNPVEPFIKDGTTYIPVRAVASALGCEVGWNGDTNTVTITKKTVSPDPQPGDNPKPEKYEPLQFVNSSPEKGNGGVAGETIELFAEVKGGTPPYSYVWKYAGASSYIDCSTAPEVFTINGNKLKALIIKGQPDVRIGVNVNDANGKSIYKSFSYGEVKKDGDALAIGKYSSKTGIPQGRSEELYVIPTGGNGTLSYKWDYKDGSAWKACSSSSSFVINGNRITQKVADAGTAKDLRCTVTDSSGKSVSQEIDCYTLYNNYYYDGKELFMYIDTVVKIGNSIVVEGTIRSGGIAVGDSIIIYDAYNGKSAGAVAQVLSVNRTSVDSAAKYDKVAIKIGAPFGVNSSGSPEPGFISSGDVITANHSHYRPVDNSKVTYRCSIQIYNEAELKENNPGRTIKSSDAGTVISRGTESFSANVKFKGETYAYTYSACITGLPNYDIKAGSPASNLDVKITGTASPVYRDYDRLYLVNSTGLKYGELNVYDIHD